jgi:hypothetical protein
MVTESSTSIVSSPQITKGTGATAPLTIDLKDLYLMMPTMLPEYMCMRAKDFPEEFVAM